MPLHDLVEYFNGRFSREHYSSFRPFILHDNKVSGLFGPIKIDSHFSPLRQTLSPTAVIGHCAKIDVTTYTPPYLGDDEIENLLVNDERQPTSLESIINFDRLSRTVHMLNFLTLTPSHGNLFLEVDPRHILGIQQDHGVYFGEVISQCGLNTNKVVIVLSVHSQYGRYYRQLLTGLGNYRQLGYQIALKFDYRVRNKIALDLITNLSPDYVCISVKHFDQGNENLIIENLEELTTVVAGIKGKSVLNHVDQKKSDLLAHHASFDLVEGSYYRAIAFDYLGMLGTKSRLHS